MHWDHAGDSRLLDVTRLELRVHAVLLHVGVSAQLPHVEGRGISKVAVHVIDVYKSLFYFGCIP